MQHTPSILIVEDETPLRELYAITVLEMGFEPVEADSLAKALDLLKNRIFDFILTDMNLGGGTGKDGLKLLQQVQQQRVSPPVAIITAYSSMPDAIEALKAGAFDYVCKPVAIDQLRTLIQNGIDHSPQKSPHSNRKIQPSCYIGQSPAVIHLNQLIKQYAKSMAPVMIVGESGTGKELVARMIHECSHRSHQPFIAINCAAIPENLIEAELFGYEKGAFTGANQARKGLMFQANGGTLFLDEIGEMPLAMQSKLLRVLQERTIRPLGANEEMRIDVRIVCATHQPIEQLVLKQQFRSDLYFRINVLRINTPALRERKGDIADLVDAILKRLNNNYKQAKRIHPDALSILIKQPFPGNVRELENILERAFALTEAHEIGIENIKMALTPSEKTVDPALKNIESPHLDLTNDSRSVPHNHLETYSEKAVPSKLMPPHEINCEVHLPVDLNKLLESIERKYILAALKMSQNHKTEAADLLGISFRQIRYRMKILEIDPHD